MMGPGMGFGMFVIMGMFLFAVFLLGSASTPIRKRNFTKSKREVDSYDEETEYFFSDDEIKRNSDSFLTDDGELFTTEDDDEIIGQFD